MKSGIKQQIIEHLKSQGKMDKENKEQINEWRNKWMKEGKNEWRKE